MTLFLLIVALLLFIAAAFTGPVGRWKLGLGWLGLASLTFAVWLLPYFR